MSRRSEPRRPAKLSPGRTARSAELARLSAATGANFARKRVRAAFSPADRRLEIQAEFELRTAEQVAEVLGNMKGAVMKLGQMASYLDQSLPVPVRDALAQMQCDAPPMSAELASDVIRGELGADPDEVFAQFDRRPLAAASIGQVHRALTHDGRDVAVKVQYPGVDQAIAADLNNSDFLFGALGILFRGMDPAPIVDELRARIEEELDYRIEAAHQLRFAAYFRDHPYIHIPAVLPEYSSRRVLCTEYVDGAKWSELLTWSRDEQNLAAETIYRFAFGGIYRIGSFNGDPHPGNYLFHGQGRVSFLDFGLCKVFLPEELAQFERMIRSMVLDRDMSEVRRVWTDIGVLKDAGRIPDDQLEEYFAHFFEQVMDDRTKEITPEYASDTLRRYFDLGGPHKDVMRNVSLPSFMVIVQRINLGLFALFGELRAVANWRRLAEEIWPFVDAAPSTAMGEKIRTWEIESGHRTPT